MQERIDTLEGFFEYARFFFTGEVAYDEAALEGAWCRRAAPPAETAEGAPRAARGGGRPDPRLDARETLEAALRALRREERLGRRASCS